MGLRENLWETAESARLLGLVAAEWLETGSVFMPTRPALRADPHPTYRALREKDPFHRSRPADGWVLTRYDDVLEVLSDRSFSSDERNLRRWPKVRKRLARRGLPDPYDDNQTSILRLDPPDHTRIRNLVSKAFTPRAVERMRGRIEEWADVLLYEAAKDGQTELVADFAAPLPVLAIAEMLGIPGEDRERFRHWSDEAVRALGDGTDEDARRSLRARHELKAYFAAICDARRQDPRDDLISSLVQVEEEGERLSRPELLSFLILLLVAGNETTTKLICNSLLALLAHPRQLDLLRSEPKRIPAAIDEFLRFDGPVQLTSRMVLEDREFRGHRLERGQQMVLVLAAANRDPDHYDAPDTLDVTRENVRPLSFGYGLHHCLGAQLAKLETSLALEALLGRCPDLRVAGEITWSDNTILRGPIRLPMRMAR